MEYEELSRLIEENRGSNVNVGDASSQLVPSPERVQETEDAIGAKLPRSFLWFLNSYGAGSVFGDEIFSIRPEYSSENMIDIAARTISDRRSGMVRDHEISICVTDFGEQFLFDSSSGGDEYPVIRKTGDLRKVVARSFAEFLGKFIREEIS